MNAALNCKTVNGKTVDCRMGCARASNLITPFGLSAIGLNSTRGSERVSNKVSRLVDIWRF